jgi:hypothetical protein
MNVLANWNNGLHNFIRIEHIFNLQTSREECILQDLTEDFYCFLHYGDSFFMLIVDCALLEDVCVVEPEVEMPVLVHRTRRQRRRATLENAVKEVHDRTEAKRRAVNFA